MKDRQFRIMFFLINEYRMQHKNWKATFSSTVDDISYWNKEIQVGRFKRNNIEILFQSIALILEIYDLEKEPF